MSENSLSISLLLPTGVPLASKLSHELIEHLPVGVYLCNAAGDVVAYNQKAADIWGEAPNLGESQVKYCGAHKLLTPEGVHIPHEQTPLAEILVTQKAVTNFHTIVERRDGSRVQVLANIVPLFDGSGTMIGFMNSVQDLRKQTAQEQTQRQLESALFQSQKMEIVGQITSGLAHDFNNQLTSLSMAFSLMGKEVEAVKSKRLSRYYGICVEAVERARGLAENLLRFSRNRPRKLDRILPNDAIVSMVSLLRSAAGAQTSLSLSLAHDALPFEANMQQLESALLNLVINARDAMPEGGTLTISTCNVGLEQVDFPRFDNTFQPGAYVVLSVADTGVGINEDMIEKVFAPFFTTKEPGKGTGLGLAMVRGFVTDMNGQLTVDSTPGQGTRFHMHFPVYGSAHSVAIKGSEQ